MKKLLSFLVLSTVFMSSVFAVTPTRVDELLVRQGFTVEGTATFNGDIVQGAGDALTVVTLNTTELNVSGISTLTGVLKVNTINEVTSAQGVDVDGVRHKDGGVLSLVAGAEIAAVDPTNIGINHVGGDSIISMTDNQTMTFEMNNGGLFTIVNASSGGSAAFFTSFIETTVVALADPASEYDVTDTDNAKVAVFKAGSDSTISVKNYTNGTISIYVNVLGKMGSATAPTP